MKALPKTMSRASVSSSHSSSWSTASLRTSFLAWANLTQSSLVDSKSSQIKFNLRATIKSSITQTRSCLRSSRSARQTRVKWSTSSRTTLSYSTRWRRQWEAPTTFSLDSKPNTKNWNTKIEWSNNLWHSLIQLVALINSYDILWNFNCLMARYQENLLIGLVRANSSIHITSK